LIAPAAQLRVLLAVTLCVLAFEACADPNVASIEARVAERQILVMLRVPPPHFRPDASYLGGYDSQVGRGARQRVAEGLAAKFKLRIVDDWPMPALGVDCFVMEAAEDVAMGQLVEDVALDARVESAQGMNLFRLLSHNDPLFPLQPTAKVWHLAEIHQIATGKNVRVAEIDSGVEFDHPDLRGRVEIARNFVDGRDAVPETHGTAVAGIIGARADNGVGIVGVAPQAALMALRACWQTPADANVAVCSSFTLAKALQFALDQDAKVVNLSLGGPRDRLLGRLLDVALSRGVVIVAAADPSSRDGGFPASVPGVLAVAADDGHDLPQAILLAPGQDIPTTLPGQRWGLVSGSSFATAQVAGLVALLLDLAPNQKPQQIRETLATSQATASSPDHRAIVDACAAVARTVGACACGCTMARGAGPTPSP
jgi:subtilisin family serine protease